LSKPASKHIVKAKEIVRAEFPEMAGAEPTISEKAAQRKGGQSRSVFVLTFQKDIPLQDGVRLKRVVRVTMDEAGEVLKLSTSK
jgi:hypothetical protein